MRSSNKDNIKALHYWSLLGETIAPRWLTVCTDFNTDFSGNANKTGILHVASSILYISFYRGWWFCTTPQHTKQFAHKWHLPCCQCAATHVFKIRVCASDRVRRAVLMVNLVAHRLAQVAGTRCHWAGANPFMTDIIDYSQMVCTLRIENSLWCSVMDKHLLYRRNDEFLWCVTPYKILIVDVSGIMYDCI